ncbi:MAG: malto-oligosyltrehalose trehalohydrolase [Bacteroidales bacterium]|nr:malto-oligosyltrehalose trehalohydrolase [Bacteroidales bacterium]
MKSTIFEQRSLGVNFWPGQEPTIRVWAPKAEKISLQVVGKNNIPLHQEEYGYWQASCPGVKPGDRYLINVNDENTFPNPASLSQPDGVHEPSECMDLNEIRKIRDEQWTGIPLQDLIIYELHVGTFTPEGTFMALQQKLDYLADLGINAIEIMPVAAFPGSRNWGYDGVFPFAVQKSYGGAIEFANLIKACHQKEIAVILDVVYNHLGPEGNYLKAFGPYFTDRYKTPWGTAVNFDDACCDGVRHYFLENALIWLRDFHVDGLRLDAVHAIKDFSPKHFLQELSEEVLKLNEKADTQHFLIAESDLNDIRFIDSLSQGGYGLDAQWCDEWHHAIHALMTGERQGYYADFGSLEQVVKAFNHGWVYDGKFSPHHKKRFGTSTSGQPGHRFVIFIQNHDHVGNRMKGERFSTLLDFESLKLAAGAMFASPFVPMLFMGEEYAEDSPFQYFISHEDKELLALVWESRKEEFREFMNDAEPPDPAAVETFERSKLKWDFQEDESKRKILAYYKKLIALRKEEPLLRPGNRDRILATEVPDKQVIMLVRENNNERLIALMNFNIHEVTIEIPVFKSDSAQVLICSAHEMWGGKVNNYTTPLTKTGQAFTANVTGKSFILIRLT